MPASDSGSGIVTTNIPTELLDNLWNSDAIRPSSARGSDISSRVGDGANSLNSWAEKLSPAGKKMLKDFAAGQRKAKGPAVPEPKAGESLYATSRPAIWSFNVLYGCGRDRRGINQG